MIGNKCDWEARRVVPKEQGEELARQQAIPFLETSAKANHNINEAFEALAKLILKRVRISMSYHCVVSTFTQSSNTEV